MQWLCALLVACVAQAATVHSFFEPHAGGFLAQTPSYSVVIAANHAVIQAGGAAVDMHFAGSQRASLSGIGSAQVRGRGLYPGVDIRTTRIKTISNMTSSPLRARICRVFA